jgi:plasmid stabilization system protein ParE
MKYSVRLQHAAVDDLDQAYRNAAKHAPRTAARWYNRFYDALQTLDTNPERCPKALENHKSNRELYQYLYGKRPNVFRAIFTIEGDTVWILRIRRAARRPLTRRELGEPNE